MSHVLRTVTRSIVALLAGLVAAIGLQVAAPGGADAYTITQQTGMSTAQRPTIYKVTGTHVNIGTPHSPQWRRVLTQPGPVVRHTTGGDQHVKVTYKVYRWNGGSWGIHQTYSASKVLGASVGSIQMNSLRHDSAYAGSYYVQTILTYTSPVGGVQSSFTASLNHSGDYACNTSYQCSTSGGSLYLS